MYKDIIYSMSEHKILCTEVNFWAFVRANFEIWFSYFGKLFLLNPLTQSTYHDDLIIIIFVVPRADSARDTKEVSSLF